MESIHKFAVKNYKKISNADDIEIKPITIIVGKNGTGKSSLIQLLLLLKQTLESADRKTALLTIGEYANAGSYKDMISKHNEKLDFSVSLTRYPKNEGEIKSTKIGDLIPAKVAITFHRGVNGEPELQKFEVYDVLSRLLITREREGDNYSCNFFDAKIENDGKFLEIIQKQKPSNFLFRDSDFFRELASLRKNNKITFTKSESIYLSTLSYAENIARSFISDIKYIGPLREAPRRFYERKGDKRRTVGSKGENTYLVLDELQKNPVKIAEINMWLQRFGLAKSVSCKKIAGKNDLLEIEVESLDGIKSNYADSCFGISQVLPLLTQSFMSLEDDIIVAEQPEIHLNPKCEVILADLLVESTKKYKCKYIIETHSDHYLLRLRTLVKKGKIKSDDVAIYLADCDKKKGNTFKRIELDDSGSFINDDWPDGLFDDAIVESMNFALARPEKGNDHA